EGADEGDGYGRDLLSEATATERKEARQRGRNQDGTTCDHRSLPSDVRRSIRTIPGRVRRCATWTRPPPSPSSRPIPSGQGRARTIWPQPRQFDYPGAALGGPVRPDGFFRGNAGRPRRCLVSPLSPLNSCRWFLRAMRRGSTGRNRLMRYIAIVALAFAVAGSAHGASNDLKAAGKGGEEDTARKAPEGTAQQI